MNEENKIIEYPEKDYFMNESFNDIVFVIEGQRVPAFKLILCAANRVFRAMFSDNFRESTVKEVVIKDTTYEAFKSLIWFLYTKQLVLKDDNDFKLIEEVCKLCDRYDAPRLMAEIVDHLENITISFDTISSIWRIAFDYNIEEIKTKVKAFIEENINQLVRRDIEELIELNETTNNFLLEVMTSYNLRPGPGLAEFNIQGRRIMVVKELIKLSKTYYNDLFVRTIRRRNSRRGNRQVYYHTIDTSFDAFQTFIGYLYFNCLVLSDENNFRLIREVCKLAKKFSFSGLLRKIGDNLKNRITFNNLESVSRLAFDYEIDDLIIEVKTFLNERLDQLIVKDVKQLFEINRMTDNSLMEVMAKSCRQNRH